MEKVRIGIVGCGQISNSYIEGAKQFDSLDIRACADIIPEASRTKAVEHDIQAMSVDELLEDKDIDLVLNITTPLSHAEINRRALEAGKHAYSEKPLAVNLEDARETIKLAKRKNRLLGCAPDMFLGSGIQTSRKILDDHWIGDPVGGSCFALRPGPDKGNFKNVKFFFQHGAGPMLDAGPYYISSYVALFGPVESVSAICAKAYEERVVLNPDSPSFGEKFPVEVPTHYTGTMRFQNGALVTMIMSFDVWGTEHSDKIEVYGTKGCLSVDPNDFSGKVRVKIEKNDWIEVPHIHNRKYSRSIGLADMARAVRGERSSFRCDADLAYHVLEVMRGFERSSDAGGEAVEMESSCRKPEPLSAGLLPGAFEN